MSLGLIALIISLVALAINAVNHFQVQRCVWSTRFLYDEIRGGNRGMIKEEETYE